MCVFGAFIPDCDAAQWRSTLVVSTVLGIVEQEEREREKERGGVGEESE